MTDRDNPGGGGLTGATGDLTPEAPDQAFEPGERREVEGADRAQVTYRQASAARAQRGDVGQPGDAEADGPSTLAARDTRPDGRTRIGGDERSDSEERF